MSEDRCLWSLPPINALMEWGGGIFGHSLLQCTDPVLPMRPRYQTISSCPSSNNGLQSSGWGDGGTGRGLCSRDAALSVGRGSSLTPDWKDIKGLFGLPPPHHHFRRYDNAQSVPPMLPPLESPRYPRS